MSNDIYWFHDTSEEVARRLEGMRQTWVTYGANPIYQSWVRNMILYYSCLLEPNAWDTSLSFQGEQGELVKMVVPQARSLTRQMVSLITKQKLAFSTVAETQGTDIMRETRIGNALANQIVTKQKLSRKDDMLVEQALVYGGCFTHTAWRSDRGEPFTSEQDEEGNTQRILYNGGLEIGIRSVFDVVYDHRIAEWEDQDWVETRSMLSRWTLIAQFPELRDEIMNLPSVRKQTNLWTTETVGMEFNDQVYVYEAVHKPTPALPQGRMVVHAGPKCVFFDDHSPYQFLPVEPCMPEPVHNMCFGYPVFSNLAGGQEMLDHSFSAIATNQSAFAVQSVTAPRGAAVSIEDIGGMNWLAFTPTPGVSDGGRPAALQLCQSSPETFKFIDLLRGHMMEISNINSALRGEPPAGVKAGVAIATLTANALEFMNSASSARNYCWERTIEKAFGIYRDHAHLPQQITMSGKNNAASMKTFVGKDLEAIKGVKFQMANPLMQTLAGRNEVAENLLQQGLIKNVQEYFSIIEGAPLQNLYKTELSENDLMDTENEALIEGRPVKTLNTDNHPEHIRAHVSLANDNDVRLNNDKVQGILSHVMEHYQLAQQADPFLMAMVRTGKMPEGGPPPGVMPGAPPPGAGSPAEAEPVQSAPAGPQNQPAKDLLGRGA